MSDGQVGIEQEARTMGWVPQAEFRGDASHWVDAETFVTRGREIMPMLRRNNQELIAKNQHLTAEMAKLRETVQASQEAIAALKEFQDENTKRQVKIARENLLAELKQAKKDEDVDKEVYLTEELTRLNAATSAAKTEEKKPAPAQNVEEVLDPAYLQFASENTWFGRDTRKTNKAMGIAQMIRADESFDHLQGKEFFDEVLRRMEGDPQRSSSKVEGSRISGGAGSGSGKKGYAALPADAKEACDRQGKKLVGEGRAYKTMDAWRARYAELYFQGEE